MHLAISSQYARPITNDAGPGYGMEAAPVSSLFNSHKSRPKRIKILSLCTGALRPGRGLLVHWLQSPRTAGNCVINIDAKTNLPASPTCHNCKVCEIKLRSCCSKPTNQPPYSVTGRQQERKGCHHYFLHWWSHGAVIWPEIDGRVQGKCFVMLCASLKTMCKVESLYQPVRILWQMLYHPSQWCPHLDHTPSLPLTFISEVMLIWPKKTDVLLNWKMTTVTSPHAPFTP